MFDEVRLSSGGLKRVKRTSETVVKMDCISSPKGNVDYVYFDLHRGLIMTERTDSENKLGRGISE
jgi:hypothetical protein